MQVDSVIHLRRRRRFALTAAGILCLAAAAIGAARQAQPNRPPALDAITEADLRRDLFFLAGDSMRGREAGTLDELRASMWIAEQARAAGMEPAGDDGTYFQYFHVPQVAQSQASRATLGERVLTYGRDFILRTRMEYFGALELVNLGAVDPARARGGSVEGKAVFATMTAAAFNAVPAGNGTPRSSASSQRAQRAVRDYVDSLIAAGAAAVLLAVRPEVEAEFPSIASSVERGSYSRATSIGSINTMPPDVSGRGGRGGRGQATTRVPVLLIRPAVADSLSGVAGRINIALSYDYNQHPTVNIVARIPGSDPALRGQYVLYSAHQDHDGVRYSVDGDSIWNGADDNATTSVALLAIGRAIKRNPTRRSSLFVWHGAEERGLHGSYWFAANPTVPRDSIVAVLNGDMIGRNHPDTAALLGSQPPHRNSGLLASLALMANDSVTKFVIDSSWDRPDHREGWYFRSDHLPYARAGVPALFFSTLLHTDYHTPKDEPDRIDITKLTRMTRWMYATGWLVGNSATRPTVDPGFRLER